MLFANNNKQMKVLWNFGRYQKEEVSDNLAFFHLATTHQEAISGHGFCIHDMHSGEERRLIPTNCVANYRIKNITSIYQPNRHNAHH